LTESVHEDTKDKHYLNDWSSFIIWNADKKSVSLAFVGCNYWIGWYNRSRLNKLLEKCGFKTIIH